MQVLAVVPEIERNTWIYFRRTFWCFQAFNKFSIWNQSRFMNNFSRNCNLISQFLFLVSSERRKLKNELKLEKVCAKSQRIAIFAWDFHLHFCTDLCSNWEKETCCNFTQQFLQKHETRQTNFFHSLLVDSQLNLSFPINLARRDLEAIELPLRRFSRIIIQCASSHVFRHSFMAKNSWAVSQFHLFRPTDSSAEVFLWPRKLREISIKTSFWLKIMFVACGRSCSGRQNFSQIQFCFRSANV